MDKEQLEYIGASKFLLEVCLELLGDATFNTNYLNIKREVVVEQIEEELRKCAEQ